jgi:stage II sporulation protein D
VNAAALLLAALLLPLPTVRPAAPERIDRIELVPAGGSVIELGYGRHTGTLEVSAGDGGLGVVEEIPLESYLLGIREVPASWPAASLAAQAVAARTYLAWTLYRGRTSSGTAYGFDICASTACQVYRGDIGADPAWVAAVQRTAGEILRSDGAPAQALYSSSAGHRTRAVQDIWGGSALPYLQPVDSDEAGVTPYQHWELTVDASVLSRVFTAGGYAVGAELTSMEIERPPEGEGPATLVVGSEQGLTRIPVTAVRAVLNSSGPQLYPGLFPAMRPGGGRWPQAILSYTFDVEFQPPTGRLDIPLIPPGEAGTPGVATFVGEGWGHGVGMSQWGAKAMADRGATYREILAHYYGGLAPEPGGDALPESVRVGLDWGVASVPIVTSGPVTVRVAGRDVATLPSGEWTLRQTARGVAVIPSSGFLADLLAILLHRTQG